MKLYLNAGFGDPLPTEDLDMIRSLGYDGIRQGPKTVESTKMIVDNVLGKLGAIFVVPCETPDLCQRIAHELAPAIVESGFELDAVIEVGNEEDLGGKRWHKDPAGWAQLVSDVLSIARAHDFIGPVVSGGISSLSHDALGWLKRANIRGRGVGVGYHQYRSTSPSVPLKGYASREEEFRALTDLVGADIWMTENGWTTTPHSEGWGPFRKTWAYDDGQVTAFLRSEIELNRAHGAKCFCVYQLNDGPDPHNDQDRFGIRRTDGTLKPQSLALA